MNIFILFPIIITLLVFGWALRHSEPGHNYSMSSGVFYYPAAAIISLIAWLIWALLK
jgi:hypothetical protein